MNRHIRSFAITLGILALTAGVGFAQSATSRPFSGAKVNGGTVTASMKDGKQVLTLSSDFKVPDTPDPHWQVVDSRGNVFLLQRLGIKGDKVNTRITLPAFVKD